jgi:ubiquinone/menaquinone biosynthesis C-methylase UbiE
MNMKGSDDIAKRYDEIAEEYDEVFQSGYRTEIQNDIVFSILNEFISNKKCRILDVGGGTGFYSIPLATQGHDVLILDKSKSMLKIAESKAVKLGVANRVKTMHGDMQNIKQPDEAFDVVLCHLALCHVDNPSKALSEFSRVLCQNGILSLIVENKMFFSISDAFKGNIAEALERFKEERLFITMPKLGTLRTFERQELLTLLEQAKLKPIRTLGLRVISDYLLYAQKAPSEDIETLKKLEFLLSKSAEWNSIGRFFFFICKKL